MDWERVQRRLSGGGFRAGGILLGLDFDGTLSELVESPGRAVLSPAAGRWLRRLARRPDVKVAVLSGRSLEDVRGRVGLHGVYYAGNHGLQIRGPGLDWTHPSVGPLDASVWSPLAEDIKDIPGALIEKKRFGLSVHYRNVPPRFVRRVAERVRARLAAVGGRYRLLPGKKTFDIRAAVRWNKGHALEAIRERLAGTWRGVFIGDDHTDEEGFATLGRRALTIRVGRVQDTSAQFVFSRRAQVDRLLEALAARPLPGGRGS